MLKSLSDKEIAMGLNLTSADLHLSRANVWRLDLRNSRLAIRKCSYKRLGKTWKSDWIIKSGGKEFDKQMGNILNLQESSVCKDLEDKSTVNLRCII